MSRQEILRQRLDQLLDALADLRRYAATVDRVQLSTQRDVQHMVLHAIYVAVRPPSTWRSTYWPTAKPRARRPMPTPSGSSHKNACSTRSSPNAWSAGLASAVSSHTSTRASTTGGS